MNREQKQTLLSIARRALEAQTAGRTPPTPSSDDPELTRPCGAFVTLHNHGDLRGCIGTFHADGPLVATISEMAVAAAQDPRFYNRPVTAAELFEIDVEISVLSPLRRIAKPLDFQLGVHGIYITNGRRTGCFLPQVAEETGWTKEQFLSYCCSHKAGLSANAWKDPATHVSIFTAEIFGEKDTVEDAPA
jgi:AmmeMemoRadiSam system protein A